MQKSCYYGSWKADKLQRRKERKLAMECQKRSCFAWYWRQQNNSGKLRLSRGRRKLLFYFLFRFERFQLLTKKKSSQINLWVCENGWKFEGFPLRLESRSQLCTQSVYGSWTFESPLGRASLPSRRFILSKWDVFDVFKLGSASRRTFFSGSLTYCVTSRHGNLLLNLFASCKKAFRVNQPIALWILSPVITDGDEGKICFSSILTWAFRHLVPPLFRTLNV